MDLKASVIKEAELSPEDYLKLSDVEKTNIAKTSIVSPHLGDNSFGKIHVICNTPLYKVSFNEQS